MLKFLLSLLAAGASGLFYAVVLERNWYAVRRHRVPCLPPDARPLRVLHISDLHLRKGQRRKRAFLRSLQGIGPDLVVGTGDFVGDADSISAAVETLGGLRGRLGSLFVLGSNDYYSPVFKNPLRYVKRTRGPYRHGKQNEWEDLVRGLEEAGWRFVSNATTRLDGMEVLGLDDAHIKRADFGLATKRSDDGFRLVVMHSPDGAERLAGFGYDLILCGHTHGGQLRIPGFGALITNAQVPRQLARGLHRIEGTWLHVNAGLGTSMYAPFRFACRPEVCVLELVPRESA